MIKTTICNQTPEQPKIQFPILMEMIDPFEYNRGIRLVVLFKNEGFGIVLHSEGHINNRKVGEFLENDESGYVISPYDSKYWRPLEGGLMMQNS